MAALPAGGGDAADSGVPDVTAPKVVHRVKSKMGYTEMHTTAPGFGENVRVPLLSFPLLFAFKLKYLALASQNIAHASCHLI